ncbi:hypothetical protein [Chakrabartyella piscis]|uniref:hypothetical protein n=1 Tax=Chakrabartyella piscis TaxID=2918914 RepID=UPI0029584ADB|nr:hypothetical protein [Chakrabartyella piscis]
MNILLVEADYKNKYPPLGLMKISAYHKSIGDDVVLVKGKNVELKDKKWDRIYITTLFTFYWKKTIDVIKYYYNSVEEPKNIFVGGIMATLLYDDLQLEEDIRGITIMKGLLDEPNMLGSEEIPVDLITPDYDIIDTDKNKYLDYEYEVKNAYITSATKGCIRKCEFCAVRTLEPKYCQFVDIKKQVKKINELYGEKRNLMLLDNNILASPSLEKIVDDLVELGFGRGNKSYEKQSGKRRLKQTRYVDFNQGTDARLLTESTILQLARLEIKPLRIAFDHADDENVRIYKEAQWLAAKNGFKNLSNYVLFNFHDTPKELYDRLRINIELNNSFIKEELSTGIWSFPMKYMPFTGDNRKDRKYIGEHWNAKLLRGVQCILNATHGVVGPKEAFFNHAFGNTYNEFEELIYMPELYITKRSSSVEKIEEWKKIYRSLNTDEMYQFINLIKNNIFPIVEIENEKVRYLYKCYLK